MDKRIFRIRYKLYKQITIFFLISTTGFSQNNELISVFDKGIKIGFLNQIANQKCNNCYFFHEEIIQNKKVYFKVGVDINNVNNEGIFLPRHIINTTTINKTNKFIQFNSFINGDFYRLSLSLTNGQLKFIEKMSYSNGKIVDGNDMFPSTHICTNEKIETIRKDTLIFDDLFRFNKKNCYDCPIKYTLKECLKMRKIRKKIIWE